MAVPRASTSFNGKATARDAIIPPKTIPKLEIDPNIAKSGVINKILPIMAPMPKTIPIIVAISIL